MLEILVSLATIACLFANFPQIYKVLKTKCARDLSMSSYIIWTLIELVLSIYAIQIFDIYFMINTMGLFMINILIVLLILKYGK